MGVHTGDFVGSRISGVEGDEPSSTVKQVTGD